MDISSKFLAGPKPGVDYQALGAKLPEIRAELEDAQKAVFDAAALVFFDRPKAEFSRPRQPPADYQG